MIFIIKINNFIMDNQTTPANVYLQLSIQDLEAKVREKKQTLSRLQAQRKIMNSNV